MNECQYCKKEFKHERTLSAHMCVKKKRMLDKDSIGSRLGFVVFQRFYELSSANKKPKTIEDFINSKYYMAFVKFGRHLTDLKPLDSNAFVDYVICNGFGIDDWCKDAPYISFLKKHVEEELHERAIERTLLEMQRWCDDNGECITDFFRKISTFEAVHLIKSGRISPWVLYLTDTGTELLGRFSEEQIQMICGVIDSDLWAKKFTSDKNTVVFVQNIMRSCGL